MTIEPDTKDWTWVLERRCPECGFDAAAHGVADLPKLLRDTTWLFGRALRGPDAAERPDPGTWSPLEYACHVRDVHTIFAERLRAMLAEDTPTFANWDQDETAVAEKYSEQDPQAVDVELVEAAGDVAGLYASVRTDQLGRRGVRSNGSEFTVETLGRYHLHDVVHHLQDIGWDPKGATVRAYDEFAAAYREGTSGMTEDVRHLLDRFAERAGHGARVLEIGSGGGRDALELEARGLVVHRTDISPGFVALLREAGQEAEVLDPLVDELGGPWDAVWASACLLHVEREDLPVVLRRLAGATRHGGVLHVGVKEGDGEAWSTHGSVTVPRRFVFWREEPLVETLRGAGWQVETVTRGTGTKGDSWLEVLAERA